MPVGIIWYHPQDYDRLMTMFPDRRRLPDTYQDWLKKAGEVADSLTKDGFAVVKAYIDPDTFPEWCRAHGFKKMNMEARSRFATDYAEEQAKAERLFKTTHRNPR